VTRPPKRVLGALAIITGSSLTFQVALTRLLAARLAYHYGFLAISLSLLGIGAAGLYVYVRPAWFERRSLEDALGTWSLVYAGALVVAVVVIVRLHFSQGYQSGAGPSGGFAWAIAATTVVSAIPAFASGIVVALAIRGYATWIGPVYAADLVGAGMGALLAVPLLVWFKPPVLIIALAVAAAGAGLLFSLRVPSRTVIGIGTGVLLIVLVVAMATSIVSVPRNYFGAQYTNISEKWTPLSRVLGYDFGSGKGGAIVYDQAWAPVPAIVDGEIPDWKKLSLGPQSIGFNMEKGGRALIIGGGGGRDIDNALTSGIGDVDVIEINAAIRDIVDNQLGSFSGAPYKLPHVHTSIGDGRAVLAGRDTKYDEIHIGFTDTLSADSAQGFALSENNLYTREAFNEYFDHLTPDGILSVSRLRKLTGPEAVRVSVLALGALEHRGIKDPERNVVILRGTDILGSEFETVLARPRPWTSGELATVATLAKERTGGIVMAPNGPYVAEWKDIHAQGWSKFCHSYTYNVCPPTDDQPFFFNTRRPSSIFSPPPDAPKNDPVSILLITLGILLLCALLAFLLPLILVRRTRKPPSATSLAYFAAIGLGYLLVEIVFIQRFVLFLGFPTYSLSVVLFSLLTFTGVGSFFTPRLGLTKRTLNTALAITVGLLVLAAFGLAPMLSTLIDQPFALRVLIAILVIAPIGVLLGMAMPIGLHRFEGLFPAALPYAWAVNGLASVVASVLGVAIALFVGFRATTLVAAACYGAALLHAALGKWATESELHLADAAAPAVDQRNDLAGDDAVRRADVPEPLH
jgi:hypothetical protein